MLASPSVGNWPDTVDTGVPDRSEFRFYVERDDFLPVARRKGSFAYAFVGTAAVVDVVEALGVAHTEIDLILVDGTSVGFDHRLRGGERVAVYLLFESLDIASFTHLRPPGPCANRDSSLSPFGAAGALHSSIGL